MHLTRNKQILFSALISGAVSLSILAGIIAPIAFFNRNDAQLEPDWAIRTTTFVTTFALLGCITGGIVSWRHMSKLRGAGVGFAMGTLMYPIVIGITYFFAGPIGYHITLFEFVVTGIGVMAFFGILTIPAGIVASVFTKRTTSNEEAIYGLPPTPPEF